jgi:hypothetical protein
MNDGSHSKLLIDLRNWLMGSAISLVTITVPIVSVLSSTDNFTNSKETVIINKFSYITLQTSNDRNN